jgi:hypothetical protein
VKNRGIILLVATLLASAGMAAGLLFAGCGGGDKATTEASPPSSSTPLTALGTTSTSEAESGTTTAEETPAGGDYIEYARSLGGVSQFGKTLFLLVGAVVKTQEEAQDLLEEAIPYFGDMQSYFIVQKSDNFEGLDPGWWIVIEAYDSEPSVENIEFGLRGFPNAYVTEAKVLTTDPIPTYEDRLGL